MTPTDEQLIAAIAIGDTDAFEQLYRRHVESTVRYAVRRCRDPHEVAELCAAVYLAVWQRADSFDPARGEVAGWISGIASHRFADLRRGDRRREALRERLVERRVLDADDVDRLAERIDAARLAGDVVEIVRGLPDSQRDVVALVANDGLTPAEAAQRLGTSPTAARMRLLRARRAVQSALGLDPDPGIRPDTNIHSDTAEVLP